ncbi:MAG: hypothetical protein SGI88_16730 [Candidatus Hydrogenedentes bacterium]|nr:hypothetical protein [Candidatus Hydrogenedentota bacterium]
MEWNLDTMNALRAWLGLENWFKESPHEDARFYKFVNCVWQESQQLWDESDTRDTIMREASKLHPGFSDLANIVADRVAEGTTILDFLTHIKQQKIPVTFD